MAVNLQAYKMTIGDTDYPTNWNNMIDDLEAAVNAVETIDNAALLNEIAATILLQSAWAESAKGAAHQSKVAAAASAASISTVVVDIETLAYWLGTV